MAGDVAPVGHGDFKLPGLGAGGEEEGGEGGGGELHCEWWVGAK